MTERDKNSCSEDTSSICDEEKVFKIFESCGGDGYIDSQDLISICHELNLEGTLVAELIHELGTEVRGRISFTDILRHRRPHNVATKNDVDCLQNSQPRDCPSSSNNSLGAPSGGKNERWEFDSGARDLSPEPQAVQKLMDVGAVSTSSNSTSTANLLQLANKLHLAALASLRREILDLSTRLQAVTEERDLLEKSVAQMQVEKENYVIQQYEDRIAKLQRIIDDLGCKICISQPSNLVKEYREEKADHECCIDEYEYQDNELNNKGARVVSVQQDDLLSYGTNIDAACNTTDTLHRLNDHHEIVPESQKLPDGKLHSNKVDKLKQSIISLQSENAKLHAKLNAKSIEIKKLRSSMNNISNAKEKPYFKAKENSSIRGLQDRSNSVTSSLQNPPIPKVAERVRLKRTEKYVTGSDISCLGVSHTEVAEHLVSSVLEQCDSLEIGNDQRKFEIETERLISKLEHTRAFNTLLQSSLEEVKSYCERLTLLVGKYENNAIALKLALGCCDHTIRVYDELVALLRLSERNENSKSEERRLLQIIDDLKNERSSLEGTVVQLESYVESPVPQQQIPTAVRRLDLETAVLIQEVMSMREEKADLNMTIYRLEKEKESLELKLTTMETQQQTQLATVQHLKMLNESLPENQEQCSKSQKEKLLRDKLREMAATLEHVSRSAEMRQKQHAEMMVELRTTNSNLLKNLEKNKHKYEARLHRMESQMLTMVSRHAAQVQTLKQRILQLLDNKSDDQHWQ